MYAMAVAKDSSTKVWYLTTLGKRPEDIDGAYVERRREESIALIVPIC